MAAAPSGGAPNAPPAENLPEFKAPTVTPPAPIPGADAAYNEQQAKIEFQLNNALAGDREIFTNAATAYNTAIANYNRTEPRAVGTQRFRAALGGYANSGAEANAQGNIRAGYLEKRTGALSKFTETANRANRQAQEAYGNRGFALEGAGRGAEERYKRLQIKNAPQEPITAAKGGPPGSKVEAGPGSPGQPLKFGFAEAERGGPYGMAAFSPGEVGPAKARQAAAQKAKKRG